MNIFVFIFSVRLHRNCELFLLDAFDIPDSIMALSTTTRVEKIFYTAAGEKLLHCVYKPEGCAVYTEHTQTTYEYLIWKAHAVVVATACSARRGSWQCAVSRLPMRRTSQAEISDLQRRKDLRSRKKEKKMRARSPGIGNRKEKPVSRTVLSIIHCCNVFLCFLLSPQSPLSPL